MNTATILLAVCNANANCGFDTAWWQKFFMYVAIAAGVLLVLYLLLSPRAMLKLIADILRHSFLRVRIYGADNIPNSGPVLLV